MSCGSSISCEVFSPVLHCPRPLPVRQAGMSGFSGQEPECVRGNSPLGRLGLGLSGSHRSAGFASSVSHQITFMPPVCRLCKTRPSTKPSSVFGAFFRLEISVALSHRKDLIKPHLRVPMWCYWSFSEEEAKKPACADIKKSGTVCSRTWDLF